MAMKVSVSAENSYWQSLRKEGSVYRVLRGPIGASAMSVVSEKSRRPTSCTYCYEITWHGNRLIGVVCRGSVIVGSFRDLLSRSEDTEWGTNSGFVGSLDRGGILTWQH